MKVQIIIGSTRPGRVTPKIAKWVAAEAEAVEGFEVEVVDLEDYPMSMLDEPISPQYNPERKPSENAQKWLDKIAGGDAYIIVSPEYNRAYSAVLKNALDYIDFQFAKKPVALVAHGSTGGAQAIDGLRSVIPALKAVTVPSPVYLVGGGTLIDDEGNLNEEAKANPYGPQSALKNTLAELKWYAAALAAARAQDA